MVKNPKLGSGDVIIMLDDQEYTLKPTLRASQAISRRFGGLVKAVEQIQSFDTDAIVTVVAAALSINNPRELQDMAEKIFNEGVNSVAPKVIEYLGVLTNGGRPLDMGGEESVGETVKIPQESPS